MSKTDISKPNGGITVPSTTSFVYRRPRSLRHLASRINWKDVARITRRVLVSASLTSAGILVIQAGGLTPLGLIGASLVFMGVGIVFGEEDTQTPEEYRQFVIEHFEARGARARWTPQVKQGQVWRHRGLLSYLSKRCYQVVSLDAGVAHGLVTDVHGSPMMVDGKAQTCDMGTFTMRYAYQLIGGTP